MILKDVKTVGKIKWKLQIKLNILKKGDIVLDIGANDGTMLGFFNKKYITIGCEPAKNLQRSLKKNCNYIINDFWNIKSLKKDYSRILF